MTLSLETSRGLWRRERTQWMVQGACAPHMWISLPYQFHVRRRSLFKTLGRADETILLPTVNVHLMVCDLPSHLTASWEGELWGVAHVYCEHAESWRGEPLAVFPHTAHPLSIFLILFHIFPSPSIYHFLTYMITAFSIYCLPMPARIWASWG